MVGWMFRGHALVALTVGGRSFKPAQKLDNVVAYEAVLTGGWWSLPAPGGPVLPDHRLAKAAWRQKGLPDPLVEVHWIAEALHAEVVLVPQAGHYPQSQNTLAGRGPQS